MQYDINTIIQKAKKGFEDSFETESFYNRQTQDEMHLKQLLNYVEFLPGMKILDLGTGTGYLAFPIAQNHPDSKVTGLDIIEKALEKNRKTALDAGIKNLQFINYNGLKFPFKNNEFDIVISRYALHHFPEINNTFQEIGRVLKPKGKLLLSDPAPNDDDTERFVDAFMKMKQDGHIKFYTKCEWLCIGEKVGLQLIDSFETYIRFPREKHTAFGFDKIIEKFDKLIIKGYAIEVADNEIWITEKVNNLLFQK